MPDLQKVESTQTSLSMREFSMNAINLNDINYVTSRNKKL